MKLTNINIISSFVLVGIISTTVAVIDRVDDGDLVHLLTGEENVVVLFTKDNCQECDKIENILDNGQAELLESIGAIVVKAHNSHMVNLYDPSREPSLIYFRRGIPLLYHGELNVDSIVQLFSENREPVVKELSDENFEHLTQASTGATTGDWFAFFYSADCVFCLRLHAVWEAVGARLRHRLTVARIDRLGAGISTASRFAIDKSPEFVFIRQGKFYRYKAKDYSPKGLIEFAEGGYIKNSSPELVPEVKEKTLMDDILKNVSSVTSSNTQLIWFGVVAVTLLVLILIILKYKSLKDKSKAKPKKVAAKKAK